MASMWIGPTFSVLEHLCIKSFLDAGHEVWLYTYDHVNNVPEGVIVKDANDIYPTKTFLVNNEKQAPGAHSDKFRYLLLAQEDVIWVDTDAYCCKPFPKCEYLFAKHHKDELANGVLKLPKNSEALKLLIELCTDDYPYYSDDVLKHLAAWGPKKTRKYKNLRAAGTPMHISEFPWGAWGPFALTYVLNKTGEVTHQVDREVLYPVTGAHMRQNTRWPNSAKHKLTIPDTTLSIHFYRSAFMNILMDVCDGVPRANSLMAELCIKHEVEPEAFL